MPGNKQETPSCFHCKWGDDSHPPGFCNLFGKDMPYGQRCSDPEAREEALKRDETPTTNQHPSA